MSISAENPSSSASESASTRERNRRIRALVSEKLNGLVQERDALVTERDYMRSLHEGVAKARRRG